MTHLKPAKPAIYICIYVHVYKHAKDENVIVSCIHRASGSNIEILMEWMEEMFSMSHQKDMFICGDFNIVLLNSAVSL